MSCLEPVCREIASSGTLFIGWFRRSCILLKSRTLLVWVKRRHITKNRLFCYSFRPSGCKRQICHIINKCTLATQISMFFSPHTPTSRQIKFSIQVLSFRGVFEFLITGNSISLIGKLENPMAALTYSYHKLLHSMSTQLPSSAYTQRHSLDRFSSEVSIGVMRPTRTCTYIT